MAVALALLPAGCGKDADLTVYSGRNEELVGALVDRFEQESGLDVEIRYGDSAELAATIREEGDNSPADVFFAQDAGSLGSVEGLLAPLPAAVTARVDDRFRDPRGRWVGTSGRARVVAFNTRRVRVGALPDSIWDYAKPGFRRRIGFAPTNASFQAMVTAMRLSGGDERTREWLEAVKAKRPRLLENNIRTLEAIDSGEIDVGFVNHYYLYGLKQERPQAPVANHYLRPGDPGSLVNVAGAGVLADSEGKPAAGRFVAYLLSPAGQRYFAQQTDEYPLVTGVRPQPSLPPLSRLQGPDLRLGSLGPHLGRTLDMLNRAGLTP